jgi:D-alanyl-D-alanine carboxypeptidase (penicillin-binding protein 5/6)
MFFWTLLLFICSLNAKPLELELKAKSAILMNAESGAILFEKEAHLPSYPASITKVATALFVIEHQKDLFRQAVVSRESLLGRPAKGGPFPAYRLEADGTMMGLKIGETLPLEVLLHGLLMVSGNDAANVLAEAVGGTIPQFMQELNLYLSSIGCKETRFCNPHGLHHPDHQSTAYDLALIAKRALQEPLFRSLCSKEFYVKPATNKQPETKLQTFNHLLRTKSPFFYSKAIGIKTGNHSAAGRTMIAAAEQDGRTLIAVILGCEKQADRYSDAKSLFEAAFKEQRMKKTFFTGSETYSYSIEGAKTSLQAGVAGEVAIQYFPTEEPELKAFLRWECPPLPIHKGSQVGELRLVDSTGKVVERTPLLAKEDVERTLLFTMKEWWNRLTK